MRVMFWATIQMFRSKTDCVTRALVLSAKQLIWNGMQIWHFLTPHKLCIVFMIILCFFTDFPLKNSFYQIFLFYKWWKSIQFSILRTVFPNVHYAHHGALIGFCRVNIYNLIFKNYNRVYKQTLQKHILRCDGCCSTRRVPMTWPSGPWG